MRKIFLNGRFVDIAGAKVSVMDRGFLYGDGVFETMRAYNGKVFALDKHISRMSLSLKMLKIKCPYTASAITRLVGRAIKANRLTDAYVKMIVTRGVCPTGIDIPPRSKPTFVIYAERMHIPPAWIYEKGVTLTLPCVMRNERSFTARIKTLNYVDNILARDEVRREGYYDPLFLNAAGRVTETATANIFILKNGKVFTPPPTEGLLPGITRDVVIGLIRKHLPNTKVAQKNIGLVELVKADEVFLTNSTSEIVPVVRVGKFPIGGGKPGPVAQAIGDLYSKETGADQNPRRAL